MKARYQKLTERILGELSSKTAACFSYALKSGIKEFVETNNGLNHAVALPRGPTSV